MKKQYQTPIVEQVDQAELDAALEEAQQRAEAADCIYGLYPCDATAEEEFYAAQVALGKLCVKKLKAISGAVPGNAGDSI